MASTPARIKATYKYNKKTYDQINFAVRRDSELNGDAIRAHAAKRGESVAGFITRAVTETMANKNSKI